LKWQGHRYFQLYHLGRLEKHGIMI
jgi:hypothetical protein